MSACTGTICAPVASAMSSAAFLSTSARRAQTTTDAPSRPSDCAAARPIPSLPPVTMATLPVRPRSTSVGVGGDAAGAAEAAFGSGSHWTEGTRRVLRGTALVPIVQHSLPAAILGQDRLAGPHPVEL